MLTDSSILNKKTNRKVYIYPVLMKRKNFSFTFSSHLVHCLYYVIWLEFRFRIYSSHVKIFVFLVHTGVHWWNNYRIYSVTMIKIGIDQAIRFNMNHFFWIILLMLIIHKIVKCSLINKNSTKFQVVLKFRTTCDAFDFPLNVRKIKLLSIMRRIHIQI